MKIIIDNRTMIKDSEILKMVSWHIDTIKETRSCGWVIESTQFTLNLDFLFNDKSVKFIATEIEA